MSQSLYMVPHNAPATTANTITTILCAAPSHVSPESSQEMQVPMSCREVINPWQSASSKYWACRRMIHLQITNQYVSARIKTQSQINSYLGTTKIAHVLPTDILVIRSVRVTIRDPGRNVQVSCTKKKDDKDPRNENHREQNNMVQIILYKYRFHWSCKSPCIHLRCNPLL